MENYDTPHQSPAVTASPQGEAFVAISAICAAFENNYTLSQRDRKIAQPPTIWPAAGFICRVV